VLYQLHGAQERNRKLVERVKRLALERKRRLICDLCRFDFAEWYGEIREGFIECHHTRPLSALTRERKTRVSEVALVCSNCHRMIHRKRPWLTMEKLSTLLKTPRG
jgi:5-methylcytosine-specific restriction protein A